MRETKISANSPTDINVEDVVDSVNCKNARNTFATDKATTKGIQLLSVLLNSRQRTSSQQRCFMTAPAYKLHGRNSGKK